VEEETYPWWRFLVRLCAVIGGVYATVGMVYNHLSVLGCSVRKFTGGNDRKHNYSEMGQNNHQFPFQSDVIKQPNNRNPIIPPSSPASTLQPAFETPIVQFFEQPGNNEKSPLCDIAAVSAVVTNLENDNALLLPDILQSHGSN